MTSHPEFDNTTTGTQVADAFADRIRGKTVLLTGASPGSIGETTALAIATAGPALLILASRTPSKLDAVATGCRHVVASAKTGDGSSQKAATVVKTVIVDLGSQASVHSAAREISSLTNRLDILINNAGISVARRQLSADGIEVTFATNHVGHFLLTTLLTPLLVSASPGARVVNVSSSAHRISPMRFSDINFDNDVNGPKQGQIAVPDKERPHPKSPAWTVARSADGFPGMVAYGVSKTANILFTVGIKRHLGSRGVDSFALHPGEIPTNLALFADVAPEWKEEIKKWPESRWKTLDQGCATTLVAALDPKLSGAKEVYLEDCQLGRPARWAIEPETAERLWRLSEDLVAGSGVQSGSKL